MKIADARAAVTIAFRNTIGREGTLSELQCLQAIGDIETNDGESWHGTGIGSFNMGAIQCGPAWPGRRFSYFDTHPNPDGTSKRYQVDFRAYLTAADGFADLARVVYVNCGRLERVLPAAYAGDLLAFSTELHRYPCYYEGFGATDADRIAHHHNAVLASIQRQAKALGEAMPGAQPLPTVAPALLLGATGEAVTVWQKAIGARQNSPPVFDAATQQTTRTWQLHNSLPPSGVVCAEDLRVAGLL